MATSAPTAGIKKPLGSLAVSPFGQVAPRGQGRGFGSKIPHRAFNTTTAIAAAPAPGQKAVTGIRRQRPQVSMNSAQQMAAPPLHQPTLVFGSKIKERARMGKNGRSIPGSDGPGSSPGGSGHGSGRPGDINEPGSENTPPPFGDQGDGIPGPIDNPTGIGNPADKLVTPDKMGKYDPIGSMGDLYGGVNPSKDPRLGGNVGGVPKGGSKSANNGGSSKSGKNNTKETWVGINTGKLTPMAVGLVLGVGTWQAAEGAWGTTAAKSSKGTIRVAYFYMDGWIEFTKTKDGHVTTSYYTHPGAHDNTGRNGHQGEHQMLSEDQKRKIRAALLQQTYYDITHGPAIRSEGGVIDPVRNQADGKNNNKGSQQSKGRSAGRGQSPMIARQPGSQKPGSLLTGPGRIDRNGRFSKSIQSPQGFHVIDPKANQGAAARRTDSARVMPNKEVKPRNGGQAHETFSIPAPMPGMSASQRGNPQAVLAPGGIHPDSSVRIGPAQTVLAAVKNTKLREALPSGNITPLKGKISMVVAPKKGATWLYNKSYQLQWTLSGSQADVKTIALWIVPNDVNKKVQQVLSIPQTAVHKKGGVTSMPFTVPAKLKEGNYFFRLKGVEVVNGKKQAYTIDSGVFIISWAITGGSHLVAKDSLGTALPAMLEYAKDRPIISFFTYDKKVKNCNGLNMQFYWQDKGQNLYGGSWTLEWKTTKGWLKKSGPMAELPMPDEFKDKQGLAKINIPLCDYISSATPFRFYLTDSDKLTGNKVSGTANPTKSVHTLAGTSNPSGTNIPSPTKKLANLATPVTFITPSRNEMDRYIRGTSIDIVFQLNKVPASVKSMPISLDLFRWPGHKIVMKIKTVMIPNNGKPYTTSWKIPLSLPGDLYYFKATSSTLFGNATSGFFAAIDKGVVITAPAKDSVYRVGDTVVIRWKSIGISNPGTVNLEFYADKAAKHLRLNKNPVPIKNGIYSWKIVPGSVPAGIGYIILNDYHTNLNPGGGFQILDAGLPIRITYPQQDAPSLVFTTPKPWQITKWLPGTSEEVAWKARGQFIETMPITLTLKNLGNGKTFQLGKTTITKQKHLGSATFAGGEIYYKDEKATIGWSTGKYSLKLPAKLPPGPYRILAQSPTLGLLGTGPVIELLGSNMTGPAVNTIFNITKVNYPMFGGPLTVHVRVNAPKSFRFNGISHPNWGTQYLGYRIANYRSGTKPEVVTNDHVSVKKNPALFPKSIFPKGISNYVIAFTPKFTKSAIAVKTIQAMPSDSLGPGEICITTYSPKLDLSLVTFPMSSVHLKMLLMNTSGIKEKIRHLPGKTSGCRSDGQW